MTDSEATDETADAEDTDTTEQPKDVTDTKLRMKPPMPRTLIPPSSQRM